MGVNKDGYAHTLTDLEPGGADEDQIYEWLCQLCSALAYVHAQGIVHRDIKLNNILLAPDKRVILSDFGISRVFEDQLRSEIGTTRTIVASATQGLVVGTQGYMAPEIERGETATPASDVYALGVVFFKLLTGVWYDKDLEPGTAAASTGVTNATRLLTDFERPWKDVLPAMLATDPARRPTDLTSLPLCLSDQGTAPCEEPTLNGEAMSSSLQNRTNHSSFKGDLPRLCSRGAPDRRSRRRVRRTEQRRLPDEDPRRANDRRTRGAAGGVAVRDVRTEASGWR